MVLEALTANYPEETTTPNTAQESVLGAKKTGTGSVAQAMGECWFSVWRATKFGMLLNLFAQKTFMCPCFRTYGNIYFSNTCGTSNTRFFETNTRIACMLQPITPLFPLNLRNVEEMRVIIQKSLYAGRGYTTLDAFFVPT
jgi:hypothetical protein